MLFVVHSGWTNLYPHQRCTKGSLFSAFLPTCVISCRFGDSHSNKCEGMSHCGLVCISLMICAVEQVFMYLLAFGGGR